MRYGSDTKIGNFPHYTTLTYYLMSEESKIHKKVLFFQKNCLCKFNI